MRTHYFATIAIAGLLLAFPFAASSNDWYVGVSAGKAENKQRLEKLTGPSFTGSVDNEDSSWKIFGGYRLWDEFVAVELSYIDLGTTKVNGMSGLSTSTGFQEMDTFTIGLLGRIPISDPLGVIIHLGFSRNDSRISSTIGSTTTYEGATDFEFYYGAGLQYEFSDTIGARIEFERFEIADYSVNNLSAGLIYRF
ncbi:MAG: porin family protein [Gammaproteobacteria bacterium]|nr:porin family protein [Gammaproteobacteria bacterium]